MSSTGNFRDQLAASLEEGGPEIIAKLREVLDGGGIVNRRMTCEHCGQASTVQVQTTDTRTTLEVAKFFTEQGLGKPATASPSDHERQRAELERQLKNGRTIHDLSEDELNLMLVDSWVNNPEQLGEHLDELKAQWQEADTLTKAYVVRMHVREFLQKIEDAYETWRVRNVHQKPKDLPDPFEA